jgi:DNA-binding transcriptional LysR family regulator
LELRHLRYFVVLADKLHFGHSAEYLKMAQPPLSQQIKDLEDELGVPLFLRTKRSVTLTDAGKTFLPRAIQILTQVDKACDEVRQVYLGNMGKIVIGFAGGTDFHLFRFQNAFQETYPDVKVILRRLGTADQVAALHLEKIDVGFLYPPVESDELKLLSLPLQKIVVALPENHPLSNGQRPLETKELAKESFIMTPSIAGTSYRNVLFNLCYKAGFFPNVTLEAYETETLLSYVSYGMGITLVPSSYIRYPMQGVVYKNLLDPSATIETAMAWKYESTSSAAHAYIEIVRHILDQSLKDNFE